MNLSVLIDNVMVNKSAADQIQHLRRLMNSTEHYPYQHYHPQQFHHTAYRSQSSEGREEFEGIDGDEFSRGTGSGRGGHFGPGAGRGAGPGRRMMKVGIGGFSVKLPRRLQLLATDMEVEKEAGEDGDPLNLQLYTANGKPRQRRPRKPKRPKMEDSYPAHIQESFFGSVSVDSKSLAEKSVEEPVLTDFKKSSLDAVCNKMGCELSERSADALRTEQEADMLGDILVGGVDDFGGVDLDNFDFNDLIGDEDGGDELDEDGVADESMNDAFSNAGSASLNICGSGMLSPSSASGGPSSQHLPSHFSEEQRKRLLHARLNQSHIERTRSEPQGTERWEEDEPLGDKATKAAVLYANLCHPDLKTKYPNWNDRVKMINRVWRLLDGGFRTLTKPPFTINCCKIFS